MGINSDLNRQLKCDWGRPIWEQFPASQDDGVVESLVTTYLGRLIPLTRAIYVAKGTAKMTLVNGLSYPRLPIYRETMMTVVLKGQKNEKKPGYLSVNPDHHIWRELESILNLSREGYEGGALALRHFENVQRDRLIEVWMGGIAANQAKLIDYAEWQVAFPAELLKERVMSRYTDGVEMAQKSELLLKKAVKEYASILKTQSETFTRSAVIVFWSKIDAQYSMLLETSENLNGSFDHWKTLLFRTTLLALSWACPYDTPRQILAFAKAKKQLISSTRSNKSQHTNREVSDEQYTK